MAIPKQVQQRSQQIEEMYQKQAQPAQQPESGQSDDDAQQNETPSQAEEHEQQGQASNENQPVAADDTDSTDGGEVVIERPEQVAEQLSELRKQVDQSEQRFKTLQGMMSRTEQENQRLQMLLSQMSDQKQEREEKPEPKAADPGEGKDREEFGDDFVDMINRVIDRKLASLEKRLGKTEGLAEKSYESARTTQQERFDAALTKRVPQWREIDTSPEFMDWLNSSQTRVAIVRDAMANYDATAIAEIFELYIQLTGTGQEQTPAPEPAKQKLEKKVAPSKGRTSSSAAPTEDKQWTRSEIAQVFRDRRRYPQKEFEKLQKDIFKAQRENRVDYTR